MSRRCRLVVAAGLCAAAIAPPGASASIPPEFAPELKEDRLILLLPDHSWAFEIEAHGFEIREREILPEERRAKLSAVNRRLGLVLSARMEPAAGPGGAAACREAAWSREQASPVGEHHVRMWEDGTMALLEYVIRLPALNARQKHVHAFLEQDGIWIEIHVSKIGYEPMDDVLFREVFEAVRIRERTGPNAFDFVRLGSVYYLQGDYQQAIEYYRQALDLEQQGGRKLSQTYWRVLVDNLGISYGLAGDLERARSTFEYGLHEDPLYPMFAYNLACTYAELGDVDQVVVHLLTAFAHRDQLMEGEEMPDPVTDPSFEPFRAHPRFQDALHQIRQLDPLP